MRAIERETEAGPRWTHVAAWTAAHKYLFVGKCMLHVDYGDIAAEMHITSLRVHESGWRGGGVKKKNQTNDGNRSTQSIPPWIWFRWQTADCYVKVTGENRSGSVVLLC